MSEPREIRVGEFGPSRNHAPRTDGIGNQPLCSTCNGFAYEQDEPGLWIVCRSCCGSGLADVKGDREPGAVARNTRNEQRETAGEKSGQIHRQAAADRETERARQAALGHTYPTFLEAAAAAREATS